MLFADVETHDPARHFSAALPPSPSRPHLGLRTLPSAGPDRLLRAPQPNGSFRPRDGPRRLHPVLCPRLSAAWKRGPLLPVLTVDLSSMGRAPPSAGAGGQPPEGTGSVWNTVRSACWVLAPASSRLLSEMAPCRAPASRPPRTPFLSHATPFSSRALVLLALSVHPLLSVSPTRTKPPRGRARMTGTAGPRASRAP